MDNHRLTPISYNNKNKLMTECAYPNDTTKQKTCKFYIKSSHNGNVCMYLKWKEFCDVVLKKGKE